MHKRGRANETQIHGHPVGPRRKQRRATTSRGICCLSRLGAFLGSFLLFGGWELFRRSEMDFVSQYESMLLLSGDELDTILNESSSPLLQTNGAAEKSSPKPAVSSDGYQYPNDPSREDDKDCIFIDSPIYRSIYVYPSWKNITDGWGGPILSTKNRTSDLQEWPWIDLEIQSKAGGWGHYDVAGEMGQYTLELIVRELMTHPKSCLRTMNPEKASLFYVPYLPSVEFHKGKLFAQDYSTSPYAKAIEDAIDGDYNGWEDLFGLTSDYWKRRNGTDHILVFSEPLHGLSHPRMKRGSYHYIHTQKQLKEPIVISVELSTAFVTMYPNCAAKNILMPYPNPDGNWYNGRYHTDAKEVMKKAGFGSAVDSYAALPAEKLGNFSFNATDITKGRRPVAQYYRAGSHGTCSRLRSSMANDYKCTSSSQAVGAMKGHVGKLSGYSMGMRMATFCPCPGGDSPGAKRMFDSILAGCIPIILSKDFVWPISKEFDSSISIDPADFSLRWEASKFVNAKFDDKCNPLNNTDGEAFQVALEKISSEEIQKLRNGLQKASDLYSFWKPTGPNGPSSPLKKGILPDGGASHALVEALANRARGQRWAACRDELMQKPNRNDPNRFEC